MTELNGDSILREVSMKYSVEQLLKFYSEMQRIRRFEFAGIRLWDANKIRGSIHPCLGQEAVAVGVCQALKKEDYIVSTHRGHGHCLAKGADPAKMMAELMGKASGCCRGRGGSMHIADVSTNNLGANGLVAGGMGFGVGAALSSKLQKRDFVAVVFFGEGASGQGMFHESLNMAAAWKLPVVFVCENNQYAVSTHCRHSMPVEHVSQRAAAYAMPGVTIDGNKVLTVYETAAEYIEKARAGEGPALIECQTYRWEGHYHGEPEVYREKEEIEAWKKKCPIVELANILTQEYSLEEEKLKAIEAEAIQEIEDAVRYAEASPDPVPETVFEYLYAD